MQRINLDLNLCLLANNTKSILVHSLQQIYHTKVMFIIRGTVWESWEYTVMLCTTSLIFM